MTQLYPLPEGYTRRIRQQLGGEADAYLEALEQPYCRGLHLNPRKPLTDPMGLIDGLLAPVPWQAKNARYLANDSVAGALPLHEAGAYYLQEPSAMAPAMLLAPKPGERILDLCAAPGGKSIQLADSMEGQGLLVCNDPVPARAKILSRNLERMGVCNSLAVSADPEQLRKPWKGLFDGILVDAPCSGEGMFRRHPETRMEWSADAPAACAARQRRILAAACDMLRPGGRLVYSTCTLNAEENEQVITGLLQEHPELKAVPFSLPIGEGKELEAPNGMLHLYPHQLQGEGHFAALLCKIGSLEKSAALLPPAKALRAADKALLAAYADFCTAYGSGNLPNANAQLGDTLLSAPLLPPLEGIKVLRCGLHLGQLKGKVFMPDHALAMGLAAPYPLPVLPLSLEQARDYQRGEALPIDDALRGFVLPTYEGLALGFGKASGGQLKNHYPKGLRRP